MLDLDTLRADHLGCYGYHRDTSPHIDGVASEGLRFSNYYASDAPCLPSRAALISGMFGIHSGMVNHGGTAADMRLEGCTRDFRTAFSAHSLWNVFRQAGMQTCSISPFAERHSAFWFLAGLNEMHNHAGKGGNESAEEITPTVLRWLDDHADDDNWVLHVNYWDPHTPYRAPADFGNPFADDPLPEWLTRERLAEHVGLAGPHTARDNNMYNGDATPGFPRQVGEITNMAELRHCIDGYDCGIRYMDMHIGQILDKLEAQGVLADTAIIISADHGENFGELGIYSEHATADQATCRIPMIVRWPGGVTNHVDHGLHYSLDLAPTMAELVGIEPWEHWDGSSYAATLLEGDGQGREELILSQCAHVLQRSVRWGAWLYIHTYHDGYHPHFAEQMLFNIEEDPHEVNNLAQDNPDIIHEGEERLRTWKQRMMDSMPFGYTNDPLDTVHDEGGPFHANPRWTDLTAYCKRLEATGRSAWIPAIKARHPEAY